MQLYNCLQINILQPSCNNELLIQCVVLYTEILILKQSSNTFIAPVHVRYQLKSSPQRIPITATDAEILCWWLQSATPILLAPLIVAAMSCVLCIRYSWQLCSSVLLRTKSGFGLGQRLQKSCDWSMRSRSVVPSWPSSILVLTVWPVLQKYCDPLTTFWPRSQL